MKCSAEGTFWKLRAAPEFRLERDGCRVLCKGGPLGVLAGYRPPKPNFPPSERGLTHSANPLCLARIPVIAGRFRSTYLRVLSDRWSPPKRGQDPLSRPRYAKHERDRNHLICPQTANWRSRYARRGSA